METIHSIAVASYFLSKCLAGLMMLLIVIFTVKEFGVNMGGYYGGGLLAGGLFAFILFFPIFYYDSYEKELAELAPSNLYLNFLLGLFLLGLTMVAISIINDALRRRFTKNVKNYFIALLTVAIFSLLAATTLDIAIISISRHTWMVIVGVIYSIVYIVGGFILYLFIHEA